MKSINPIQMYPHIIESYACTLQIAIEMFLFPMNFIISFGICSTPKLSKYVSFLAFTYKANEFLLIHVHQDLSYLLYPLL